MFKNIALSLIAFALTITMASPSFGAFGGGPVFERNIGIFNDGTSTRPSITFSRETDLGFYRSGTNAVSFVGGTLTATMALVGDICVDDAAGSCLMDEEASATNPTLIPNRSEVDTGLGWVSDTIHFIGGGISEAQIGVAGTIFNEGGLDRNFKIKSEDNTNMFVIDGGDNSVSVGGTVGASALFAVRGTFAPGATTARGFLLDPTLTVATGQDAQGTALYPTLAAHSSGTHTNLHGVQIGTVNITDNGATITNAASLIIDGAPTEAANNYALWVDAGDVRFDGDLAVTGEITGAGFTGTLDGILGGGTPAAASVTALSIFNDPPILTLDNTDTSINNTDVVGELHFKGYVGDGTGSGSTQVTYGQIGVTADDVTGGTEDGQMSIQVRMAGASRTLFSLNGDYGIRIDGGQNVLKYGFGVNNPTAGSAEFAVNILLNTAAGPAMMNRAATSTAPTLIPNRAETDTGWGWASDKLHAVLGGANTMQIAPTGVSWGFDAVTTANTSANNPWYFYTNSSTAQTFRWINSGTGNHSLNWISSKKGDAALLHEELIQGDDSDDNATTYYRQQTYIVLDNNGAETGKTVWELSTGNGSLSDLMYLTGDVLGPGLHLDSGAALYLEETSERLAKTNYGCLWTETDNKLHFKDGAGTEYTVDVTAV